VIKELTDDLARVMIQIGAGSIAELTSDLLARKPAALPREPSSNRIGGLLLHHLLDQRLRARSRPS